MPRCLLEKPYPPNLLTIPSCCECNTGFKQDEEYFLAVMAQSSIRMGLFQYAIHSSMPKADPGSKD